MPLKYNWLAIAKEYIEGYRIKHDEVHWPTILELAQKYNINEKLVGKHCTKEQWRRKRDEFQAEVERIALEKAAKKRARDIEEFKDDCYKAANAGKFIVTKHLEKAMNDSKVGKLMPLPDLESASRSLERVQTVGHRALGVPDKATALSGPDNKPIAVEIESWTDIMRLAAEDDKKDGEPSSDNKK